MRTSSGWQRPPATTWKWFRRRHPVFQGTAFALLVAAALATALLGWVGDRAPSSGSSDAGGSSGTTAGDADDRLLTSVTEIVDGDTVYLDGLAERLRLIGIDTPETSHPDRGVECYGREAAEHLAGLIPPGTRVRVEWDVERHDHYDRPLGYLYRAEDDLFVNERMLLDGYAQILTVPPNVTHQDRFLAAQQDARAAEKGLWAACGDEPAAAGTR